jgi:hypothetical protein
MQTVIWIAALVLLVYLLVTFVLFQLVCRRFPQAHDPFRALTHATDSMLAPYRPVVEQGRQWLQSQSGQAVEITSFDGLTLRGTLYQNPADGPLLLAFHGYRSNGVRDFATACPFYFSHGLSILLVDQRAAGQSEGTYITLGMRESRDVADWCRWAQSRFPDKPLVAAGISMGASSVLLAAPNMPEAVKAIIADCGYAAPWEELRYVVHHNAHLPADWLLWGVELWCRWLGGFSLRRETTEKALHQSKLPLFLIHGETDQLVPYDNLSRHKAAGAGPCTVLSVPEADHGISYLLDTPGYQAAAAEFLRRYVLS